MAIEKLNGVVLWLLVSASYRKKATIAFFSGTTSNRYYASSWQQLIMSGRKPGQTSYN